MTRKYDNLDNTICTKFANQVVLAWKGANIKEQLRSCSSDAISTRLYTLQITSWDRDSSHEVAFSACLPRVMEEDPSPVLAYNIPVDEPDDEEINKVGAKTDLLIYRLRLGHISFNKLHQLEKIGNLPKRLLLCQILTCYACMFGKATKISWRNKGRATSTTQPPYWFDISEIPCPVWQPVPNRVVNEKEKEDRQ